MASSLPIATLLALVTIQGEPLIETRLAWEGAVSGPAFTELYVGATSTGDTQVLIEASGRSLVTVARLQPRNGTPDAAWLPIGVDGSSDVTVRYSIADRPWVDVDLGRLDRSAGLVILAGESAIGRFGGFDGTRAVAVGDLPRLVSAYTHVDALVLGADALGRLDEKQLLALLEYVGICGRLLLIDAPPQVEWLVAQRAGCGGSSLHTMAGSAVSANPLVALVAHRSGELPDERALRGLFDKSNAQIRLMALYLGGFLLVFVALVVSSRGSRLGLVFSLLATGTAGLLWTADHKQSFVAWAEVSTTERVARYAGLERVSATGRGDQELQLRSLARSPMRVAGDDLVLHWSEEGQDRYLQWSASLLKEMQVFSMGSFPVEQSLRAYVGDSTVVVCNLGKGEVPPGYVRWQGVNYVIPALVPGQSWAASEAAYIAEPSAPLRMLARRSAREAIALLHPLRVPANGGNQNAWLMRTESRSPEGSLCRG